MSVVQIIFLVINLSIPAWIWLRHKSGPDVDWNHLEQSLKAIVATRGFAPCTNEEALKNLRQVCDVSQDEWSPSETVEAQSSGANVVFSCEVTARGIHVRLRPGAPNLNDNRCGGKTAGHPLRLTPEFDFDLKGELENYGFTDIYGGHARLSLRQCALQGRRAAALTAIPDDRERFLNEVGRVPHGPRDFISANLICLTYGPDALWAAWRKRYSP